MISFKINKRVYLSDKILVIIFCFSTIALLVIRLIYGGSWWHLLALSYFFYIFSFLCAYFISRLFSVRILDLTYKVQAMAAGDLSRAINVKSKDEISQLSNAINELISRLQTGVAQDVSKHKALSRAKSDFVTLASHQLRTPLSIIKWYVDFLVNGDAGDITSEQKKYLEEVYVSNERLIELVNALLDVSRIDVGTFSIEPEPADIILLADLAMKKFDQDVAKKRIRVIREYQEIPIINLDPRLTKIVFENIFSNSVKYTPEEGIIKVVIKKTEKDVLIKISDNGCGIPKEQQPKIFSKLFRADNVRKIESVGTGLGLYIVKAAIEKSGGKIWFQSPSLEFLMDADNQKLSQKEQMKGTTFYLTIPLKGMKAKAGTKKLSSLN